MKKTREQIKEAMSGSNMHKRLYWAVGKITKQPVYFDHEFILMVTVPDFYIPYKNLAIYIDGPIHRLGNQRNRDEELRAMLAKKGLKVVALEYVSDTEEEFQRLLQEIKELIE